MTKTITRRAAIAGFSAHGLAPAFAQSRPEGTITIVHGFTPGGNVDLTARLVAERLAAKLGQQVVVEPKPGAGGSTAAAQVARATPDGTTLFLAAGGHAVSAAIYNKLPYRRAEGFFLDQHAVGLSLRVRHLSRSSGEEPRRVHRAWRRRTRASCSAPRRATAPASIWRSSCSPRPPGSRSSIVPYRGSPQAATDLLGKRVDAFMDNMTVVAEMVKDGRLRALGITGPSRFFVLPDVPTFAEAGVPGYAVTSWLGLAGPAGIPQPTIAKLNAEVVAILNGAGDHRAPAARSAASQPTTPDGFRSRVASDIEKWTKVVADAGIARI